MTGFLLLPADLENMAAKPREGGGSKNWVLWKVEKAIILHTQIRSPLLHLRPRESRQSSVFFLGAATVMFKEMLTG